MPRAVSTFCLLLVLLLGAGGLACDGGTSRAAEDEAPSVDRYVQGELRARIESIQDAMPRRGSEGFVPPTSADLDRWRAIVDALIDDDTTAVDVFQQTGARVLLLAGTHRCANQGVSPCDGTSSVCGDGRYHVSDMAHVVDAPFQAAHAVFTERFPEMIAISLHGNGSEDCETVFLSNGIDGDVQPELRSLQQALAQRGVQVGVPGSSACRLIGGTNVQGRLINGSPHPCTEAATQATGTFIHVEQRRAFREDPAAYGALIDALNDVF